MAEQRPDEEEAQREQVRTAAPPDPAGFGPRPAPWIQPRRSRQLRRHVTGRPYLLEVVEALWPGGPVGDGHSGAAPVHTLLAVPGTRAPSVLLPSQRASAAAALRAYGGHGSRLSSLRTRAAGMMMASGLGSLLFRDRVPVRGGGDNITHEMERILGVPVQAALKAGPPRANRKPVLALVDRDATVVAFAKIGISPLADRLVRNEADALQRLAGVDMGVVRAPRAIHCGVWRDMVVLVQEALPTQPSQPVGTDVLVRLVRDVSRAVGGTAVDWAGSDHARRGSGSASRRSPRERRHPDWRPPSTSWPGRASRCRWGPGTET